MHSLRFQFRLNFQRTEQVWRWRRQRFHELIRFVRFHFHLGRNRTEHDRIFRIDILYRTGDVFPKWWPQIRFVGQIIDANVLFWWFHAHRRRCGQCGGVWWILYGHIVRIQIVFRRRWYFIECILIAVAIVDGAVQVARRWRRRICHTLMIVRMMNFNFDFTVVFAAETTHYFMSIFKFWRLRSIQRKKEKKNK